MEELLLRTEKILVEKGVDTKNPYTNNLIQLGEVKENVILDYNEKKLTRAEYFRTLFKLSMPMLMKHIQFY